MLKSVYGYLFLKKEQDKRPVPSVNQFFSPGETDQTTQEMDILTPRAETPITETPSNDPYSDSNLKSMILKAHPIVLPNGTKIKTIYIPDEYVQRACKIAEECITFHDQCLEPPINGLRDLSFLTYETAETVEIAETNKTVETAVVVEAEPLKAEPEPAEPEPAEPELALIRPVQTVDEFRKEMTEHIVVQKKIHEERLQQQALDKIERPKVVIRQWMPNDALAKAHDTAAEAVGKVPTLLKKIKQYQEKIATKQNDIERIQNKNDINPYDRFEMIDIKKDIITEQAKISTIDLQLQEAQQYIDDPIFEEFALYLVEAEEYIKEAELVGIMDANDILTSEAIYNKTKSLMDSIKYGKKNPALMERLQFISERFNMAHVHENSRGKNLHEFKDFFITDKTNNPLYLFDRLDAKAIGNSGVMKALVCGPAGGMIDQDLVAAPFVDTITDTIADPQRESTT